MLSPSTMGSARSLLPGPRCLPLVGTTTRSAHRGERNRERSSRTHHCQSASHCHCRRRSVRFPTRYCRNEVVTLAWSTTGATSATINDSGVSLNGSMTANPTVTTTLHSRGPIGKSKRLGDDCQSAGHTSAASLVRCNSLVVGPRVAPFRSPGRPPARPVVLDNGIGIVEANGTMNVTPQVTTLYALTASNDGSVTKTRTGGRQPATSKVVTAFCAVQSPARPTDQTAVQHTCRPRSRRRRQYLRRRLRQSHHSQSRDGWFDGHMGQSGWRPGFRDGRRNNALFDFTGFSGRNARLPRWITERA